METLIKSLIEKLGSAAWKELRLGWGVKEQVDKLQRQLQTIIAVLGDAEKRSIGDGALRKWLEDLKDAAYDADDVLDEFQTEALQPRLNICAPVISKVNLLFSNPCMSISMAHKVQTILKKFNELAEEKNKFHLAETSIPLSHPNRETSSFIIEDDEIFGREDDKRELVEWLINDDNVSDVSILPVVGLGGLGKTTLAQLVYNNKNVTDHFHIKKWVCVGETFEVNEIVKAIIGSDKNSKLEEMLEELRKKFGNKKYLLIIDDVWNEEALRWEELKKYLKVGMGGSKIIVTTRSQRVAEIMGTVSNPCQLKVLSDDDCWMLFKKRAFGPGREDENQNLVQIGREIVKKCGGLPLAAKSIGSLMATKHGENEWRAVKDSEFWRKENSPDGIIPALRVSFDHLPPQLKQCFAYCSLFPKDFQLNKVELIQLWIAEGFIGSEESACLEDIGEEYFNILLWRSFFQEEQKDEYGKIESCKMHDLIHDLGCFVTADESSTFGSNQKFDCRCRRVSLFCSSSNKIRAVANEARKLRSLFLFWDEQSYELFHAKDLEFALSKLIHLRVLYLKSIRIKLVSSIGKLKHLRFLNLSDNYSITSLPDSITNLYNLQVLNIKGCGNLKELPKGMKKMSNLRHLYLDDWWSRLDSMPSGMGELTKLQTLSLFKVGNKPDQLSIVELQHLKQIRGSLKITGLGNVKNRKDAAKAELDNKEYLQSLYLYFDHDDDEARRKQFLRWPPCGDDTNVDDDDDDDDDIVIENLRPHPNLKVLAINYYGYNGSRLLPNWLTEAMLPYLVMLSLEYISRCESLPAAFGQFRFLKELKLFHFPNLKRIEGAELFGETSTATFPSLKSLYLGGMDDLEEWSIIPQSVGEILFPVLETLFISGCPKLKSLWTSLQTSTATFPSLKSLWLLDMYDLEEWSIIPKSVGERLFPVLETLEIKKCPKLRIQSLSFDMFPNLVKLELADISTCESLPAALGQFRFLKELRLESFDNLKRIVGAEELFGETSTATFPSLKSLTLKNMKDLEEWSIIIPKTEGEMMMMMFPILETLTIYDCPKLMRIQPSLPSSILKLSLRDCNEELLLAAADEEGGGGGSGCLQGLSSLTELFIEYMEASNMGGSWKGLQYLTNLQKLEINYCDSLESLPEGIMQLHIPSLRTLHLFENNHMKYIIRVGELEEEEQQQQPPPPFFMSLHRLVIYACPELIVLPGWLGGLTSLQTLYLYGCPKLQMLPDGFQHLTGLNQLNISNCPILEGRCKADGGEDWHKISHIPNLQVFDSDSEEEQ